MVLVDGQPSGDCKGSTWFKYFVLISHLQPNWKLKNQAIYIIINWMLPLLSPYG